MKKLLLMIIWLSLLLTGCNGAESIEEAFDQEMNELDYEIIEVVEEDEESFVIHTLLPEDGESPVSIAYLKKSDQEWQYIAGTNCEDELEWGPVGTEKYLWCGLITDSSVEEIFVDREAAEIVDISETLRVWYSLSSLSGEQSDMKIWAVMTDGTEEWLEDM
ncbi:hypothetical protein [Planomicrobium sp. Y74]|uniref:hypothetical protein n=1 Tax=Planomicrobium sp. Y74 TaxID=2478977 RepID=UPI000EF48797|nr:hypothetical protein [Planomicrobium sp. Y74]RLQ89715.1 hypothetical protein D9754_13005 [Planomicrobium sp. Y74]